MAIRAPERVGAYDGFRVESVRGPLGVVEETWLGPEGEPAGLAVRTPDGRRGLLLAVDVAAVLDDDERVTAHPKARLLELDAPRLERETGNGAVLASWSTTGSVIEPLPRRRRGELEVWQIALLLYAAITTIAAVVMTLAFSLARALA